MKKPATLGLRGTKTRFDEFQAIHQLQTYATHFVGAFLPFHRLMMHAHETALRNECGYTGHQPYWHEQLDAGKFSRSFLLDATYGFGGDRSRTTGCITNGPFANYTNSLGPGYEVTSHCINRRISDAMSTMSSQAQVDAYLALLDLRPRGRALKASHTRGDTPVWVGRCRTACRAPVTPFSICTIPGWIKCFGTGRLGIGRRGCRGSVGRILDRISRQDFPRGRPTFREFFFSCFQPRLTADVS